MNEGVRACADDAPLAELHDVGATGGGFLLRTATRTLHTHGCQAALQSAGTATLAARVQAFFAEPRDGLPLLVGALPFDPVAADALHQPQALKDALHLPPTAVVPFSGEIVAEPLPADYADAVQQALSVLDDTHSGLRKVVLARSLCLRGATALDPHQLAARLGQDPGVAPFAVALPDAPAHAPAWLVGASPELLVSRHGPHVLSHPLAGSARRCADPDDDQAAAQALLGSAKDHDEHRYVVDAIVEALAPWCRDIDAPSRPSLTGTASMWHLGTRIEATLRDPATPVATLLAALHPTPAVCGTPREAALATIRALEPQPRGFYAGAVGWMDAHGDGEWYVAIRCARVQGTQARVYAGAGIVAGSQPALEVAETAAKFGALLTALGVSTAHATGTTS